MRRFSSYGPVDPDLHYYAPRKELIEKAYTQLMGEDPRKGGHYFTVWAPRQTGKSWAMLQVLEQIQKQKPDEGYPGLEFDVVKVDLDLPGQDTNLDDIASSIADEIFIGLGKKNPGIDSLKRFPGLFTRDVLDKPLILVIDEFDALPKEGISQLTRVFRTVYMRRQRELIKPLNQRRYMLHSLALIGVRSVLGIENEKGSPFNIQRSVHIPNLDFDEVKGMFQWYEKESGQKIDEKVIQRLYDETRGQPGLTCWFGELLTEGFEDYTNDATRPIGIPEFETVYAAATDLLPNNNILNIISKANDKLYKKTVLELFKPDKPVKFKFDNKKINFLYMNGVIVPDIDGGDKRYVKFSCPFVQKRLFNYFSDELFPEMEMLVPPEDDLADAIDDEKLDIGNILKRYKNYLVQNHDWLFKKAPRRNDSRVYEAVFHFNLYMYLSEFLDPLEARVYPEFPTGNGKVDLVIHYREREYAIEVKSFRDVRSFREALPRAAYYGKQLGLGEITLVLFVEAFDEKKLRELQVEYRDPGTGVTVKPVIILTGRV